MVTYIYLWFSECSNGKQLCWLWKVQTKKQMTLVSTETEFHCKQWKRWNCQSSGRTSWQKAHHIQIGAHSISRIPIPKEAFQEPITWKYNDILGSRSIEVTLHNYIWSDSHFWDNSIHAWPVWKLLHGLHYWSEGHFHHLCALIQWGLHVFLDSAEIATWIMWLFSGILSSVMHNITVMIRSMYSV